MTVKDIFELYLEEELPEFFDIKNLEVNTCGRFGNYPLNIACIRGKTEEVAVLLSAGANIDAVGELGNQAIHDAIFSENTAVVKLLVNAGACLTQANFFGDSPIALAKKSNNQELKDIILSSVSK